MIAWIESAPAIAVGASGDEGLVFVWVKPACS
jgi:hypothetical protein